MNLNITSVIQFLPYDSFTKSDLSECSFILRNKLIPIRKLDKEDSKTIALIYLNEILPKRLEKIKKEKELKSLLSELYRICIKYKVDCYAACCRFIEYKLGTFIECPDRIPTNVKYSEQQGYWWNNIKEKTGYYSTSCGDILNNINILNGTKEHINHSINPVEYIYFNLKQEFINFINQKHKILPKHFKSSCIDYSHMAYNNSSNDF